MVAESKQASVLFRFRVAGSDRLDRQWMIADGADGSLSELDGAFGEVKPRPCDHEQSGLFGECAAGLWDVEAGRGSVARFVASNPRALFSVRTSTFLQRPTPTAGRAQPAHAGHSIGAELRRSVGPRRRRNTFRLVSRRSGRDA